MNILWTQREHMNIFPVFYLENFHRARDRNFNFHRDCTARAYLFYSIDISNLRHYILELLQHLFYDKKSPIKIHFHFMKAINFHGKIFVKV